MSGSARGLETTTTLQCAVIGMYCVTTDAAMAGATMLGATMPGATGTNRGADRPSASQSETVTTVPTTRAATPIQDRMHPGLILIPTMTATRTTATRITATRPPQAVHARVIGEEATTAGVGNA